MRASSWQAVGWMGLLLWGASPAAARVVAVPQAERSAWESWRVDLRGEDHTVAARVYAAWRAEGWLWARVQIDADTLRIEPGLRASVRSIDIGGADASLEARFRHALDFSVGSAYRPGHWPESGRAAIARLGEEGYPFVRVDVRKIEGDAATGAVDLWLWLSTGPLATISEVVVDGATHTRPEVLARLAGAKVGAPYRESDLARIRERLLTREVIDEVVAVVPTLAAGGTDGVSLRIGVVQPQTTGRVSAALGITQDREARETRVSGRVDLALLDLFGSARQLEVHWLDDGRQRRTLDLAYLEPVILGTPLDLKLRLGQRHEDDLYDTIVVDADLRIPWRGEHRLELGLGLDRTTFVGEGATQRNRRRARAALSLGRRRPDLSGVFGRFNTVIEAARVAQTTRVDDNDEARRVTGQTILDTTASLGFAFQPSVALVGQATWRRVDADELPLPLSEQWRVGGATTVRGYEEQRFSGEQTAYGRAEVRFGRARRAQAYLFFDHGWVQETRRVDQRLEVREQWLSAFGLGLRAPVAVGDLDISLGFPGTLGFEAGKLHVALDQRF